MAVVDTQVTLDELTDAIVATLQAALGESVTVVAYGENEGEEESDRKRRRKLQTPAVVVELVEMQEGEDLGTDQLPAELRFDAYCLVSGYDEAPRRAVRALAMAVSRAVRLNRWGLPVAPSKWIGAFPDEFSRFDLKDFDVWRVEWSQLAHFGESVWLPDPDAIVPTEVYVGVTPDIGPDHVDDYVLVTEDEP